MRRFDRAWLFLFAMAVFFVLFAAWPVVQDVHAAGPCTAGALDGSFASAAVNGSIAAGEIDCYTLSDLTVTDSIAVVSSSSGLVSASPRWAVVDANDVSVCEAYASSVGNGTRCDLSGSGPWSVRIFDGPSGGPSGTFSYQLAVRRLTSPQGCSSLGEPGDWSFPAPRINGSSGTPLEAQCLTFTRAAGEADGNYWFRTVRTSGDIQPYWTVYGPSGSEECSGSYGGPEGSCKLLASGKFALVVSDQSTTQTGSYFTTAKRLTSPGGCTALPSISYSAAPVAASISNAGDADCLTLPNVANGDAVAVGLNFSGIAGANPRWALLDGNGTYVCDSNSDNYTASCTLTGADGWFLLVYDYGGGGTFSYTAAVRRLNDPQGCSSLGDPAIWSFATPRINGSLGGPLAAQCFTFSRADGEADGTYWFRALHSSGALSPYWTVYGPAGSRECEGSVNVAESNCKLLASGQFSFVVRDQSGTQSGSYFATSKRLSAPTGCSALPSTAYGAAPTAGAIAVAGEADCHTIPGVSQGDSVAVGIAPSGGSNASPRWTLVDGSGAGVCDSSSYSYTASCTLTGASGWSLLVYDSGGTGTFSYSTAVRRLTDPQGCSSLGDPAIWSFTAPRANGALSGLLDAQCFTFSRDPGEADARYWFRVLRASGQLQPQWSVYGPSGSRECSGSSNGAEGNCKLLASGKFALVISDQEGTRSGAYFATSKRLTATSGCASAPSVAFGISAMKGNLSTAGEADCYTLAVTDGDILNLSTTGSADRIALVDPEGEVQCYWTNSACPVHGDGPFELLLYSSSGTSTGSYQLDAKCENVPCGQSNTAVTDVTPNRIGPSEFTSVLLRGRDLELLSSVTLSRSGQTRVGEIQPSSPDGRAAELRFDLSDAAFGAWDLSATFIDGTTRFVPAAATVEALKPARMSVETVGRDIFRPGTANSITLEVTNEGNVDGLGVPLVLGGIPQDAQIEPMFEIQDPVGSLSSPQLEEAHFEPAEDTVLDEETSTLSLPLLLSRVPAGRTVRLEYRISVPTLTTYQLQATVGQCLATELVGSADTAASAVVRVAASDGDPGVNCIAGMAKESIAQALLTAAEPNKICMQALSNAATDVIANAGGGGSVTRPRTMFSWLLGGASCAVEVVPVTKAALVAKKALKLVSTINRFAGRASTIQQCLAARDSSRLQQRGVASIDPNDILGPVGSGTQRYISGSGPLGYQVLFENLPAATAPAQRIEIEDQLDPTLFNPGSVLFQGVGFGTTDFTLPIEEREIDQVIDLRPARNLLVQLTAGVSGAGLVHVVLQAIDPETLAPPDDPMVGILPPNVTAPEGEGHVSFSVRAKAPASGQVLPNKATIRFDGNDPIETPTWSNVVDKAPPAPSVKAGVSTAPLAADVSWGGSDDASGISLWRLEVSRDGGPYELWRTASEPGSDTYAPGVVGSYSFRTVAYDGAGNDGQSALSGVTLSAGKAGGGEVDNGGEKAGGGPAAPTTAPAAAAAPASSPSRPSPPAPKPLRCRKGFKKVRAKGKVKCVRIPTHHRKRHPVGSRSR
jgi:hypothetical protein